MKAMNDNHSYLGDGVYVEYLAEVTIILRTDSHIDSECENIIYLEESAVNKLIKFIEDRRK